MKIIRRNIMFDIILIHPKVVDFTIALFSSAILFDMIGLITKNEKFHWAAWVNLIFAGLAAVLSAITGLIAEGNVPHGGNVHEIMEIHKILGIVVMSIILLLIIWRIKLKGKLPEKIRVLYLVAGIVGWSAMFAGAFYGGEMVFTHGVAVKAVPLSDENHNHLGNDESHDHSEIETAPFSEELNNQKIMEKEPDMKRSKNDTLKRDVHQHKDGSEHVHN
jgi:uncharacterized membrane protein